jgi:phage shock protein C
MSAFRLDRANAKMMGVCGGLARATGIDPLIVRISAVIMLLALGIEIAVLYFIIGWVAR